MKRVVDDERIMLRVCDLYYNQNLGQQEIAQEMKLSRPTVSRLLINAREKGIVKIILADLNGRNNLEMEQRVARKYGLKEVIVTDSYEAPSKLRAEIGSAAARFLERILKNGDHVGISMGKTLSHIAPYVTADYFRDITFVPMLGGVGDASLQLHSNFLAEALGKAFNGNALALHAPAMVSRIQVKTELLQEESIARILSSVYNLDVAVSGIGAMNENSTVLETGYFSKETLEELRMSSIDKELMGITGENGNYICGDICLQFFDRNGNQARYEHNQRVIGINIESLRNIPWSIGVAGGISKVEAIQGALKGKYINSLITDIECAKLLVKG